MCINVLANDGELIFGIGNGVHGYFEVGLVAFHKILVLIVAVSGYKLQDTQVMSLNRYLFNSQITCFSFFLVTSDEEVLVEKKL